MSMLRDESGKASTARALLWLVVLDLLALLNLGLTGIVQRMTDAELTVLSGLTLALIAWAGGARALDKVGPMVSGVAAAIMGRLSGDARRVAPPPSQHEVEDAA